MRIGRFFRRRAKDAELEQEIEAHIVQETDDNVARGMSREEARRRALIKFGSTRNVREDVWEWNTFTFLDDTVRDLRFAMRTFSKSPAFTAIAVLVMALGIGANTALFSVVNAVLLKPLSYRDPDRIVTLSGASTKDGALLKPVSGPDFQDFHERSSFFEAMACYISRETSVMLGSTAEYAQATGVSPEFFRVFAVEPIVGRFLTAEEVQQGSGGALMISHDYWQSHFGKDPRVVGRTIRGSGRTLQVGGVLPPGFHFPANTDFWVTTR